MLRDDQQFKTAIDMGEGQHTMINLTDGIKNAQRQLIDDDVPNKGTNRVDKKTELNKLIQNVDIKI